MTEFKIYKVRHFYRDVRLILVAKDKWDALEAAIEYAEGLDLPYSWKPPTIDKIKEYDIGKRLEVGWVLKIKKK